MFVVKRPFRNRGKVLTAGSVITDPADIKRFKGRLAEGKIINVTEQTYDNIAKYFKQKHGVDIGEFIPESTTENTGASPVADASNIITPETTGDDTKASTTEDVDTKTVVQTVAKVVTAVVK